MFCIGAENSCCKRSYAEQLARKHCMYLYERARYVGTYDFTSSVKQGIVKESHEVKEVSHRVRLGVHFIIFHARV